MGGGTAGTAASSLQQSMGGGGSGGLSGDSGTFGTGELQGPQFTQFGQAGAAVINQDFVGVGQTGQFVGVGQTTGAGQTSQQGLAGLGNRGQGQGQSQGRSTTSTGRSRVERLQPIARIAFDYEPATTAMVQTRLETQVSEYGFGVNELAISLDAEGVLTLSGVAPTDDARRLAEAFMRLEPGVRQVENQIIVAE